MNTIIKNKKKLNRNKLLFLSPFVSLVISLSSYFSFIVKQQVVVNSRKQLYLWVAWFLHGFAIAPDNSVQNALQL